MTEKNITISIPALSDHAPSSGSRLMEGTMGQMVLQGLEYRMFNPDCMSVAERMANPFSRIPDIREFAMIMPQPRSQQPAALPTPAKLRAEQLAKDRCQTIAKMLWKDNPNLTIGALTRHPLIRDKDLGGAQFYEARTVYDWIAEIKNHPQKNKRGRPRKSLKS